MSDWSSVDRSQVMAAIAECDRLGSREFLSRYRFGRAKASSVWHDGQEYDSKALLGLALLYATGRPATKDDFSGGERAASRRLSSMGFDVVLDEEAVEAEDRALAERAQAREPASTSAVTGAAAPSGATTKTAPARKRVATKKVTAPKPLTMKGRPSPMDQPKQLCPTCFMAVPMTGVCDNCG